MFWQNKELDELKKENEQLKAFLKTDREEKCEAHLKQNPEGNILGLIKKYPLVGNKILEQHYAKGELAKSFIDGSEHYKLTAVKETRTEQKPEQEQTKITEPEPKIYFRTRKPKWDSKIRKEVKRLRLEGKEYKEIAKLTGVPRGSISKMLPKIHKGYKAHKKKYVPARKRVPARKTDLDKREKMVLNCLKLKDRQSPKELGISTGYGRVDVLRKIYTLRAKGYPIKTIWKTKPYGGRGRTGVYTLGETPAEIPTPTKTKKYMWERVSDPSLKGKSIKETSEATGLTPTQIYYGRWEAKKRGKALGVTKRIPQWKQVSDLVKEGKNNKEISEATGLTNHQICSARWQAEKNHGVELPFTSDRYTKVSGAETAPTTSTPKEDSDYVAKARLEDKTDEKTLCESVGVDYYHYKALKSQGFKSPYEFLLVDMLFKKSIKPQEFEVNEFLTIATKRANIVLPEGLKRAITERAIAFYNTPNLRPKMKQKIPNKLEEMGITFPDIEDFLLDYALKPKLELNDWKQFVRNYGELSEADFRANFDWLNNIIMGVFRRNKYNPKISYSGYDRCYYFHKWRRIKGVVGR